MAEAARRAADRRYDRSFATIADRRRVLWGNRQPTDALARARNQRTRQSLAL